MAKIITSRWRTLRIITVVLTVIIFYGIAITLLGMTIVKPVWIIGVSILFAAVTALAFWQKWKKITTSHSIILNVICHLIASTGLFMGLILGVNYFGRNTSDSVTVRAEVIKVYSETRYRMKRIARNRYTRGEPYQVYFMDVQLPNGSECKKSISLQRYNRFAWSNYKHRIRPDSVDLRLTKGAFGMKVIEREPNK